MIQHARALKHTTAGTAAADHTARPKVLRRPAHFSESSNKSVMALPVPSADIPPPQTAPLITSRAWQDDGRFAVVLLAIVAAINLVAIIWLSFVTPTPKIIVASQSAASIAQALPPARDAVTIYAPDTAEPVSTEAPSAALVSE